MFNFAKCGNPLKRRRMYSKKAKMKLKNSVKDIKVNSLKAWILAARPKTLAGAAVPVMIGATFAFVDTNVHISVLPTVLCLLFALTMQINANLINDYFDFIRGKDDKHRLGPRRACAQGWISIEKMKRAIIFFISLSCLIGLPLISYGGWMMLLIGALCVLFSFLYTTYFSSRGMGDLLVLLFFGLVPVCGTYYLAVASSFCIPFYIFVAAFACGLVIDSLLVVNNYRDIDNDERVGKITLVVRLGRRKSELLYLLTGYVACLLGLAFVANGFIFCFIFPLIYLFFHTHTYQEMARISKGKALNMILEKTARNILIYGLLIVFGLLFDYILLNRNPLTLNI